MIMHFLGHQTSGAPDIYIRTGGELTTDDTDTANFIILVEH